MFISIVTPSYNRYQLLKESIHSSIKSVQATEALVELIVVDDASTDETFEKIQHDFSGLIDSGFIRVFKLDKNSGVTAAKNFGARKSTGEWVLFLDSDDLLISENFSALVGDLQAHRTESAVFFKCVDFGGDPIGEPISDQSIDLNYYIKHGFHGERLPVIKRDAITFFPYEDQLRGFEGLAYYRMLASGSSVRLSGITARKYRTDNIDRLSRRNARIRRAPAMRTGYRLLIEEYRKAQITLGWGVLLKYLFYQTLCALLVMKPIYESVKKAITHQ